MSYNLGQQTKNTARVRSLFVAALVLACAFGTVTQAAADDITPPEGNSAFLVAHAFGTQGYVCLPTSGGGTSWTINPARPEATLFVKVFGQDVQIITHFTSINATIQDPPLSGNVTWQGFDTSKVWAKALKFLTAGDDPKICPNTGAIPCVLLQSIGNQEGPTGGRLLAKVTFIQRLNTKDGAAPTTACSVGQTQLQHYEADYVFFHKDE